MPNPLTRRQLRENEWFLTVLAQTGNARLAAREVGRGNATMHGRRIAHADFAQRWDAAVAAAHARFHLAGGRRGPEGKPLDPSTRLRTGSARDERKKKLGRGLRRDDGGGEDLRTAGGEPVVVRTRNGRLQLRPAHRRRCSSSTSTTRA